MEILIADVWSIYNAGDRAILEALIQALRQRYPGARLTVAAHLPGGCDALGGIRVVPDVLAFDQRGLDEQFSHVRGTHPAIDRLRACYEHSDLVVSTGGYFLNATPGNPFTYVFLSRLLHFDWSLACGVPIAILGQSIGPIDDPALRVAARATLGRIPVVVVRDAQSFSFLQRTGIAPHARFGADLAVTLAPEPASLVRQAMHGLGLPEGALGLSARIYPGTPAGAFRDLAQVADEAVRQFGVPVLLIGTTVPPDHAPEIQHLERGLGNDDLVALEEIHRHMEEAGQATVVRTSLPPRLLKGVLATCRAFISTRMHAAILATTSQVPTVGIAYEYKVAGWFDQLGLPELAVPLAHADTATLWPLVEHLFANEAEIRAHLARVVPALRHRAEEGLSCLPPLARGSAGRRPSPEPASQQWAREAFHYDLPHRRLERICQMVEGLPGERVLDLGCSAGTLGANLSERWIYHGCDLSVAAAAAAPRGNVIAHDLERGLPALDGARYDVIIASGIVEYLERVPELLEEVRARLVPDGRFIVSYFNMQHCSRRSGTPFRHPLWRNDWAPQEFRRLLDDAGFEIVETGWSTMGRGPAPDVAAESDAIRAETSLHLTPGGLDDLAHTLIYLCRPMAPVAASLAPPGTPEVSVVIPAHNRLDLLGRVLHGFASQKTSGRFEIVLVDDGSEPPVSSLLHTLGPSPWLRVIRHSTNRGRAAALNTGLEHARGTLIVFCDSDIEPSPNFIRDHLAFHRSHPGELETLLGALEWGVEPGLFGALMGPRANPSMHPPEGPINWTRWYTDNWSFKRRLLDARGLRFDPRFRAWGWEEIELAFKLEAAGASNRHTGDARGRHLKSVDLATMLRNFARSVPNLLLLAESLPASAQVDSWLSHRMTRPEALAASEAMLQAAWNKCEQLDGASERGLRSLPPVLQRVLSLALSDVTFGVGIARGFAQADGTTHARPAPRGVAKSDEEQALGWAILPALVLVAGKMLQHPDLDVWLQVELRRLVHHGGFDPEFLLTLLAGVQHTLTQAAAALCRAP